MSDKINAALAAEQADAEATTTQEAELLPTATLDELEQVDLGTVAAYDISPVMMELFGLRQPLYFQFLGRQLRAAYRANTRGTIMEKDGTTSNELTPLQQKWNDEHWLLQYDLMFGKGYALGRMGRDELAEDAE